MTAPTLCVDCQRPVGSASFRIEGRGPLCADCLRGIGKRKVKGLLARVRGFFGAKSS